MVLPSQIDRSGQRRSQMFRRRRLPRLPILLVAGGLLAGATWLIVRPDGPSSAQGSSPDNDARDDAGARLAANANATQSPPRGAATQDRSTDDAKTRSDESHAAPIRQEGAQSQSPPIASHDAPATPPSSDSSNNGIADTSTTTSPARTNDPPVPRLPTSQQLARGLQMLDTQPLEARRLLSTALESESLNADDEENIRMALTHLNDRLIFGRTAHPDDPFARTYKVQSGELLGKIVKDLDLQVDWRFLCRINSMPDARALRAGQDLKIITGPFHAVIDKSDYRLDLYLGEGEERIFARSFKVGLGEYDSTPAGMFRIGVKAEEPTWVNPRDPRQKYAADDPTNPIGDHWLALIGIDDITRDFTGYGIHGTIEPDSIGKQQSMGCIRMLPDDVKLLFEVLMTDVSTVEIRN